MHIRWRQASLILVVAGTLLAGCAGGPSHSELVAKLKQQNSLTNSQATCVADGLFGGMPRATPPIRALSTAELNAVAKPDNAGKVSPDVIQILRDVVSKCVPEGTIP